MHEFMVLAAESMRKAEVLAVVTMESGSAICIAY